MFYFDNSQIKLLSTFAFTNARLSGLIDDFKGLEKIREYYYNKQPNRLSEDQRNYLGLKPDDPEPRDNILYDTVSLIVERLEVTGWEASHPSDVESQDTDQSSLTESQKLEQAVQIIMQNNGIDSTQDDIYEAAIRDGRCYLIVDYDNSDPLRTGINGVKFHIEMAAVMDNNYSIMGIQLHKDKYDNPQFASHRYITNDVVEDRQGVPVPNINHHLVIYYPDKKEHYIMDVKVADKLGVNQQAGWVKVQEDDWVDQNGNPLGIPVFEFSTPGGSAIDQLISLQDAINDNFSDIKAVDRLHGFPIIWGTGAKFDKLILSPGRGISTSDEQGRVGKIDASSSENLHATELVLLKKVARKAKIPLYSLYPSGQPWSGVALIQMEGPTINLCNRIIKNYTRTWQDIAVMSIKLAMAFGAETGLLLDALSGGTIKPIWAKPYQPTIEDLRNEAAAYKEAAFPDEYIWERVYGLSPQEVAKYQAIAQSRTNQTIVTAIDALNNIEEGESDGNQETTQ